MCGRFAVIKKFEELKAYFGAEGQSDFQPNYNVAPTHMIPVVLDEGGTRKIRLMRWSFVPEWSDTMKTKFKMINAKSETVATSPAYRDAFKKKRCIIPASGFYEWERPAMQPHYFTPKEGLYAFCGIWSAWKSPESGEVVETCAMLTTAANEMVARVHDRMPVAITNNMIGAWLAAETQTDELQSFLAPYPASQMKEVKVSQYVNKVQNCGEKCIERLNSA